MKDEPEKAPAPAWRNRKTLAISLLLGGILTGVIGSRSGVFSFASGLLIVAGCGVILTRPSAPKGPGKRNLGFLYFIAAAAAGLLGAMALIALLIAERRAG